MLNGSSVKVSKEGSKTKRLNFTVTLSFLSSRISLIKYFSDLIFDYPPFFMSKQSIEETPLSYRKLAADPKSTVNFTTSAASKSIISGSAIDQDVETFVI